MSIPYLGSKRTSADRIVSLIKAYYPEETRFYDLFCGGLAVSEAAQLHGFYVHASDIDEGMVALANEIMFGECKDPVTKEDIFMHPRFIEREEFVQSTSDSGDSWWNAYIGVVWGYGNNRRSYLYSQEREGLKKSLFALVVDGKTDPALDIPLYAQKKVYLIDNRGRENE